MQHHSNEFILPHKLSPTQHDVLIGGLLGDTCIVLNGKYPRFKIDRQFIDKKYLEWQYNLFKDLCLSGIKELIRFDKRYNKWHKYVSFRTRAVPAFLDYYNQWYINGKKQVPYNLELNPLILAVWFADDGCIVNEVRNQLVLKLSTESFGENGAGILSQKLENRFNIKFPIYRKKKDKDQFFIKASTCAAQLFIKEIEPYIIDMGMDRKYNVWKDIPLDIKPKLGLSPKNYKEFYGTIISLKDFSINDISRIIKDYKIGSIRGILRKFHKLGYLDRYESEDEFNLYHYRLTDSGENFFSKEV